MLHGFQAKHLLKVLVFSLDLTRYVTGHNSFKSTWTYMYRLSCFSHTYKTGLLTLMMMIWKLYIKIERPQHMRLVASILIRSSGFIKVRCFVFEYLNRNGRKNSWGNQLDFLSTLFLLAFKRVRALRVLHTYYYEAVAWTSCGSLAVVEWDRWWLSHFHAWESFKSKQSNTVLVTGKCVVYACKFEETNSFKNCMR